MERSYKKIKPEEVEKNISNIPRDLIIKMLVDMGDIEAVRAFCHTNNYYKNLCKSKEFLYKWFQTHEPKRFHRLKTLQLFDIDESVHQDMINSFKKAFQIARIRRWAREYPDEFNQSKLARVLLPMLENDSFHAIEQMYNRVKRLLPPIALNKRQGAGKYRFSTKKRKRSKRSKRSKRKRSARSKRSARRKSTNKQKRSKSYVRKRSLKKKSTK